MTTTRTGRISPAVGTAILVIVIAAVLRFRVVDVPLERDEGEYAYAGQLILQGIPPYTLVYNMKFPGTYYAYAAIEAVFGQTPRAIHLGLILVNAAAAGLLFLIGRRLLGDLGAVIGVALFCAMTIDRWTMAPFAHATHFVLVPLLLGVLLMLRASDSGRARDYLLCGVGIGTAVLMKQQALAFVPFIAWIVWLRDRQAKRSSRSRASHAAMFVAGLALPLVLLCLLFTAQGVIGKFWFWTFHYARAYVSEVPMSEAWFMFSTMWSVVTRADLALWLLAIVGLLLLWMFRWPSNIRVTITSFVVASILAISPGFYFREHYFILLIPAAALCGGAAIVTIGKLVARLASPRAGQVAAVAVAVVALGSYVAAESDYLFAMSPTALSRSVHGFNPFIEAPELGRYIREHSAPDDRIAVLGSEPEIYFYAHRKSATGYIYTYPLMEPQPFAAEMQAEMMSEIEAARPKFVVVVQIDTSWSIRPTSNRGIINWMSRFVKECYTPTGAADLATGGAIWRWGADLNNEFKPSTHRLLTYERKADVPCQVAR